jgi:Rrf2 family protein
MKLTSQEEYGLRCILSLARALLPGAGPGLEGTSLTVQDIARREGLSVPYAGKLIRLLGRAGLVESVRGRKGGYRLARPPESISVAQALAALGGKIYEAGTCDRYTGDRRFCVHTNDCSIRSLWSGIQILIDGVLSRTTLHDLIQTEKTMARDSHDPAPAAQGDLARTILSGPHELASGAAMKRLSKET